MGGGIGGVAAAKRLVLGLQGKEDSQVVLITNTDHYLFPPLLTNVALGDIGLEDATEPLTKLKGVEVIKANVTSISPDKNLVLTDNGKFEYDYLIASLGTEMDYDTYNLKAGYNNFSEENANKMRDALKSFKKGNIVVFTPEPIYRCGVYPFEIAGQLDAAFRKQGIRNDVNITLIHPFEEPIQPLGKEALKITKEYYKSHNINYIGGKKPVKVDGDAKKVVLEDESIPYDFLITVPPARMPKVFEGSGLEKDFDSGKWTAIEPYTGRSLKYNNVYLPGEHSMAAVGLPLAGIPVHFMSLASADAILGEIRGKPTLPVQVNNMVCAMDYGELGMIFNCDMKIDEEKKSVAWMGNCYSLLTSPLSRMLKDMFYKTWLKTYI